MSLNKLLENYDKKQSPLATELKEIKVASLKTSVVSSQTSVVSALQEITARLENVENINEELCKQFDHTTILKLENRISVIESKIVVATERIECQQKLIEFHKLQLDVADDDSMIYSKQLMNSK